MYTSLKFILQVMDTSFGAVFEKKEIARNSQLPFVTIWIHWKRETAAIINI